MRFCVLGPLEAYEGERPLKIGGGRQRALLALLLVHAGEVVSRDRLVDELWHGAPPSGVAQSLDAYLSRLRRALREAGANGALATRPPGYLLHAEDTDAAEFETAARSGHEALARGDYERAAGLLRGALALWRGTAYTEVADEPWARPEGERLEELRVGAIEDRIEADLALGRHAALVPELELLAARHPTRERLVGQLMLALYRCGRQADALAAYRAARGTLVDQLGLEPGPDLRRLETAVLAQDSVLDLPREGRSAPQPVEPRGDRPVAVEGERKQVTVLFVDVVGSMELAERVDPEEWQGVMQGFFSILCEGVHRLEGTVDKFTGDGIMALFGAPIAHEDHARRACYAALHLRQEIAFYTARLRDRGLGFSARMGLSSGEVVIGAIGEDQAMQYTAVGHTVGLAQRLEQLAEPDAVCLAPSTAALVEGFFELRDLGEVSVKGASRPIHVHALVGVGTARDRLEVVRGRGLSPLVGRGRELRVIDEALQRALDGDGQLVGIVGEAGVGKSRLCHEFAKRQRGKGVAVYHVGGHAHAQAVPLVPVLEFLRGYFEIAGGCSGDEARAQIADRLLGLDAAFGEELPLVFDFLGVPDPEQPVERMDPEARQRRLLAFMKRLTRAQAAREPTVTVIEDLHWLDPASAEFLANHVDAVQGTRGLTIVNFRPEYHAPWMSRSYYQQIALDPLGREAVEELLVELLGDDPSLEGVVAVVGERTQGNPFFIEEVARSLAEAGSLEGEPGRYRLVQPVEEITVPASVHAVLAARIDRLAPAEKAVLQAAAVIGREFPLPVLEGIADRPPAELDDSLRALTAAEFVYEQEIDPETVFAFKHPLTREVAYRSLLMARRKTLHAATARVIAERYPQLLDERAALLAQHWEAAGDAAEAARWYARAATWSGSGDPTQAFGHWSKVRELADALPESTEAAALRLQARVSLLLYAWRVGISDEDAEQLHREADTMAREASDLRARTLVAAGYASIRKLCQGDDHGAASGSSEAFALAEASGDRALYLAVALQAYAYYSTGEYRAGLAIHARAIDLARGDPTVGAGIHLACPYANSHVFKAVFLTPLGALKEAARLFEQGRELAYEHGDLEVVSWSHMWSVWLAYFQGEPEAALHHGRQAVEIAERIGGSFARVVAWFHLGGAESLRGEPRRALEALERSAALADERGTTEHDGWRLALLGEAYLQLGDPERAIRLTRQALEITHARGNRCEETHASLALARVLLHSAGPGAYGEIETALTRARELAHETHGKAFEPLVHVELAELARQTGDARRREHALREAHRLFTEIGATGHAERVSRELQQPAG